MSKNLVRIRYDGPVLANHAIDVNHLAPALLSIGDLCKLANEKFNGERASVKVLVSVDAEHSCFELSFELVQTIYDMALSLIKNDDVKNAKQILEWLGIITMGATPVGLFKLLKWLRGRKIESQTLVNQDGKNVVEIKVEGDSNMINVYPQTMELYNDVEAIKSTQKIVKPLTEEGYNKLEFEYRKKVTEEVSKKEANDIMSIDVDLIEESEEKPQEIIALVKVYSPVYDVDASVWRFEYGDKHEYMDVSETEIVKKAIERGWTSVDDIYRVRLEITQVTTRTGKIKNRYKIKEVLEFRQVNRPKQLGLFEKKDD